jgi:plastocyanin domain-containing protein
MTEKSIVTIVGILLIIFVNWYFLFSKKRTKGQDAN